MKKNTILTLKIASVTAMLALALPVLAETSSDTTRPELNQKIEDQRREFKDGAKEQMNAMRETIKNNREAFKEEAEGMRNGSSTPEEIKEKREAMMETNQAFRESTKEGLKAKREAMRADIKKQILDFKDAKKVKLDDTKKAKVKEVLNRAFTKLSAQVTTLENFNKRVEDKIAQEKAKGSDTSAAETALISAKLALEDASTAVSAVNAALTEALGGATEISREAVTAAVQKAVDSIKNAREKYRAVLKALPRESETATTTSATN